MAINTIYARLNEKVGIRRATKSINNAFEHFVFSTIFWQVAAGVDIQSAVRNMSNLIRLPDYNAMVDECCHMLGQAQAMTVAFTQSGLARSSHLIQVLNTAEQSGNYTESLLGFLQLQKSDLELTLQHYYQWIPRVYYALAIIIGFAMVL